MSSITTTTSVAMWTARIRPHLEAAADNIIAAGRQLIEAKEALDHGQFLDLTKSLDLRPRTAQKFMSIARNQLIANASPGAHLPTSWTTLYELSRAPTDLLEEALAEGEVTPDMSRKEALQLVTRLRTRVSANRAQRLTVRLRQAQWEMGGVAAGFTRAGGDIACCSEMVGEVDPPVWEMFGFDGPVAWLENCIGIFTLFPEPDFSRPWAEQEVAS